MVATRHHAHAAAARPARTLGARLGAAVHKCGQRAVAEPPAIAVAALVDVVAGQVTPTSALSAGNTRPLDSHSQQMGGLEAAEATEIIDCTVLGLAIVDAQGPRTGAAALPRSARPQACTSAPKWLAIVAANAS